MAQTKATFRLTEDFEDDIYPDSDGKPMGETDFHIANLVYLRAALQGFFRDQSDVYVATDMFLYYEEGNPKARKAPDVMVVRGVDKHFRRSFKLWREAAGPETIFELVSRRTWKQDVNEKPRLYAKLGVSEYYLFDPEARLLDPPLQGFRRRGRAMVQRRVEADGSLVSKALGLRLLAEGHLLRLVDVRTGQPLPTLEELAAQTEELAAQSKELAARSEKLTARAEAAEAELARLRTQQGRGKNGK